jgi:hypothetical protein
MDSRPATLHGRLRARIEVILEIDDDRLGEVAPYSGIFVTDSSIATSSSVKKMPSRIDDSRAANLLSPGIRVCPASLTCAIRSSTRDANVADWHLPASGFIRISLAARAEPARKFTRNGCRLVHTLQGRRPDIERQPATRTLRAARARHTAGCRATAPQSKTAATGHLYARVLVP